MRGSKNNYSSYRGRRTLNDILKLIAFVLAALVVLVLGGLAYGQNYLVFTDNGPRLSLPFRQEEEEQEVVDPGNISVIVQPADRQDGENPVDHETVLAALELPVSSLLDGTAAERLEEAGANALILTMKDEEGQLGWLSQQETAARAEVNSTTEGINEILRQWNQGEVYTIARVCCFRDNTVPYQRNDLALRASYGNWRDERKLRWMNPDSAAVQSYLAGLCGELAELGFDEILLDCYGFPAQGNLEAITKSGSYESGQYTGTVEGFLEQVKKALEPWEAALSLQTGRAVLTGEDAGSGLTPALLENYGERLWIANDQEAPALADLLANAGITRPEERLVEIVQVLDSGGQIPQAAFLQA